ncbi:MAG: hypothetical protein L7S56_05880 [Candidatus Poseidonia sp.]|nr:hypothetical protein [Poseidonia sp.]
MNVKYVAKNPTPVAQTITLPQGMPLDGGRLRSAEAITVQVPPMSVREILYDEEGKPVVEGCIQDLSVTIELDEGTPIDPHSSQRVRTQIRDFSGDRTAVFYNETRRVYPNLVVNDQRSLGGAQLLAQFSHLRSQRDNTSAIYSPAALNMAFESRTDSLYHAASQGRIEIQSIVGDGYNRNDAINMRVHNPTSEAVRLLVPQGTMVEQQTWNGNQNLVVKEDVWIDIQPGQTGSFPLPAFCANASAGSPNNDLMNLTPFIFNDMGQSFRDQDSMWRTTDSRRGVRMR